MNDLNAKIQNLRFCISDDDSGLEAELKSCDDYNDKIAVCLGSLDVKHTMPSPNIEDVRTLLKSPVAPLPKFSSTSDEDITRFFHIFEETTNRYKYPSGDKFLLLKQQVSGRGALLLDSLSAGERRGKESIDFCLCIFTGSYF